MRLLHTHVLVVVAPSISVIQLPKFDLRVFTAAQPLSADLMLENLSFIRVMVHHRPAQRSRALSPQLVPLHCKHRTELFPTKSDIILLTQSISLIHN